MIVCDDCPSPGTSLSSERMITALERERVRIANEKIRIKLRLLELDMAERKERRLEMWDDVEDQHSSSQAAKAGKSLSYSRDKLCGRREKQIISSEDYGSDLASVLDLLRDHKAMEPDMVGAEALLGRHRYFRGEIDAREKNFHETMSDGKQLLGSINSPVLATAVLDKLRTMEMKRAELLELWDIRQSRYEQLLEMEWFLADVDDAETWMAEGESFLMNENIGDSLDLVDAQLKEHEDFEESLMDRAEYFSAVDDLATKLIAFNHYAAKEISQRRFSFITITRKIGASSEDPAGCCEI